MTMSNEYAISKYYCISIVFLVSEIMKFDI
jgi:hypothetical protein